MASVTICSDFRAPKIKSATVSPSVCHEMMGQNAMIFVFWMLSFRQESLGSFKESWAPKNWCFWTMVLDKTLESPLDCKKIQPVHPEGNQSWIFIGRTDVEAETPILWLPDANNWLIWKDPVAGKDQRHEKGITEDEMSGWHHQFNEHEFEQAPGVGDGQGSLAWYSPWGRKESDTAERLNWSVPQLLYFHYARTHEAPFFC